MAPYFFGGVQVIELPFQMPNDESGVAAEEFMLVYGAELMHSGNEAESEACICGILVNMQITWYVIMNAKNIHTYPWRAANTSELRAVTQQSGAQKFIIKSRPLPGGRARVPLVIPSLFYSARISSPPSLLSPRLEYLPDGFVGHTYPHVVTPHSSRQSTVIPNSGLSYGGTNAYLCR